MNKNKKGIRMKYTIELSPFQILFNSEMYRLHKKQLNLPFSISPKYQKKISESIKIIKVDKKNSLTTIEVTKIYQKVKRKIIEYIPFFLKNSNLEKSFQDTYRFIIELTKFKNHNSCIVDDILKQERLNGVLLSKYSSKIPRFYLHQAFNTQIIDILSTQISSLIKSCVGIALRKIRSENLPKNSNTQITNFLLNPLDDFRASIIKTKLGGKYWTSSRHLALVSNEYISFHEWEKRSKNKISSNNGNGKKRIKKRKDLRDKLIANLPETLVENFQLYLKAIPQLSYYKTLDAQIQVRQAYLLKKFLEYFKKNKKFSNEYIYNIKTAKNVIKMLRGFYE